MILSPSQTKKGTKKLERAVDSTGKWLKDFGIEFGDTLNDLSGKTSQNNFNAEQAALDRDFQSTEAEKQRQWEKEMSDTAHQREMADMQAAGLNPVLSVLGGNGASTPSGYAASGSTAHDGSGSGGAILQGIASAVSSASSLMNANTNRLNYMSASQKANAMKSSEYLYDNAGKLIQVLTEFI